MNKYYITFGSEGQVFKGGWVEIFADSEIEARDKFEDYYPDSLTQDGFLRFAASYDEETFKKTKMYKNGNLGNKCHEIIK